MRLGWGYSLLFAGGNSLFLKVGTLKWAGCSRGVTYFTEIIVNNMPAAVTPYFEIDCINCIGLN